MGEAEINHHSKQVTIYSAIYFYGNAANDALSYEIAKDIEEHWNGAAGKIIIKNHSYNVRFSIKGIYAPALTPEDVQYNNNPRNNYFRIEEYAAGDISFVDGLGSNTGYFKLDNLLNHSTTAAHEYGHTLGLEHPDVLDIRGMGVPGIMYPRGTVVDPPFQYNPYAAPLEPGGTINPFTRKVLQSDIDNLQLHRILFTERNAAIVGAFSSVWHDAHIDNQLAE